MPVLLALAAISACIARLSGGDTLRLCNGERVRLVGSKRLSVLALRGAASDPAHGFVAAEIRVGAIMPRPNAQLPSWSGSCPLTGCASIAEDRTVSAAPSPG